MRVKLINNNYRMENQVTDASGKKSVYLHLHICSFEIPGLEKN